MIKTFGIVLLSTFICFSFTSLSQERLSSDNELNYIFNFPNKQGKLLLSGYKESEDSRFIYASEFYVIDIPSTDTIISFGALQSCKIDKNSSDSLIIIESKKLPVGISEKWQDFNYLEYNFNYKSNRVIIDSLILLDISKTISVNKQKVVKEYERAKAHISEVSEELSYFILYLALQKDDWAKEKLFSMKDEVKLDGVSAEINQDAIKIYQTYYRLK
jgi:hypothetical protein